MLFLWGVEVSGLCVGKAEKHSSLHFSGHSPLASLIASYDRKHFRKTALFLTDHHGNSQVYSEQVGHEEL